MCPSFFLLNLHSSVETQFCQWDWWWVGLAGEIPSVVPIFHPWMCVSSPPLDRMAVACLLASPSLSVSSGRGSPCGGPTSEKLTAQLFNSLCRWTNKQRILRGVRLKHPFMQHLWENKARSFILWPLERKNGKNGYFNHYHFKFKLKPRV